MTAWGPHVPRLSDLTHRPSAKTATSSPNAIVRDATILVPGRQECRANHNRSPRAQIARSGGRTPDPSAHREAPARSASHPGRPQAEATSANMNIARGSAQASMSGAVSCSPALSLLHSTEASAAATAWSIGMSRPSDPNWSKRSSPSLLRRERCVCSWSSSTYRRPRLSSRTLSAVPSSLAAASGDGARAAMPSKHHHNSLKPSSCATTRPSPKCRRASGLRLCFSAATPATPSDSAMPSRFPISRNIWRASRDVFRASSNFPETSPRSPPPR